MPWISSFAGTNALVEKGYATALVRPEQILGADASLKAEAMAPPAQIPLEATPVLRAMGEKSLHVDDIIEESGAPGHEVAVHLLTLAALGVIREHPPGWYRDPSDAGRQRYWDGTNWTEHVAPLPPVAPVAPAAPAAPQLAAAQAAAPPRTNGLAVASFVLALLWLCGLGSLLGVVFGHVSVGQIKRDNQRGRGLAIAGTIIGYLGIAGLVLSLVAVNNASRKNEAGVTAGSKPAATAGSKPAATDSAGVTVDAPTETEAEAAPNDREPVAVAGFTKYEALGETWVSVGLVLTGLSGGSQELTITLLDVAGTPLATTTDYVGSDRDGGEVLVSSGFTDNTPTVASVRVDLSEIRCCNEVRQSLNHIADTDACNHPVRVTTLGRLEDEVVS
jgi:hypothetical protein